MSDGWSKAAARVDVDLPTGVTPPGRLNPVGKPTGIDAMPEFQAIEGRAALVVTDRFDLRMIAMNVTGARLLVVPLPRTDALELVARYKPEIMATNDRGLASIEKELGIEASRPVVRFGTRLLVVDAIRWNDVRYTLVTYESDGDGCVD